MIFYDMSAYVVFYVRLCGVMQFERISVFQRVVSAVVLYSAGGYVQHSRTVCDTKIDFPPPPPQQSSFVRFLFGYWCLLVLTSTIIYRVQRGDSRIQEYFFYGLGCGRTR